jgi:hypothetical protein
MATPRFFFARVLCREYEALVLSKHCKCHFTVAASSSSTRYKDWTKQANIRTIVLGVPSLVDFKTL